MNKNNNIIAATLIATVGISAVANASESVISTETHNNSGVLLAHASIAENGRVSGSPGDQTGREVCVRNYYNNNWTHILRPKKVETAIALAQEAILIANNPNIGYCQTHRNTALKEYKKCSDISKIEQKCDVDCSSFVTLAAIASGIPLTITSNSLTTRNMISGFLTTGEFDEIPFKSETQLRTGDILLKKGRHVAIVVIS